MIDYLWGWQGADTELMCQALVNARPDVDPGSVIVRELGNGTLVTIGQAYSAFEPVETDDELLVVLGGPRPSAGCVLLDKAGVNSYSDWLLQCWPENMEELAFDLIGGFQLVKINKHSGGIGIVTDAASFVPCYATTAFENMDHKGPVLCGSHADAVAQAAAVDVMIDEISVADFLMHQTVTYPYTFYRHVHQLPPASHLNRSEDGSFQQTCYWRPEENPEHSSVEQGALELRKILKRNVAGIAEGQSRATVLMSGGEDSRVVLAALPKDLNKKAVTVTDFLNHEAKVARKVSKRLGASWQLVERSPTHYVDEAPRSIRLSESHNFFYHAHFCGLEKDIGHQQLVVGGVMADAYCKGCHVKSRKHFGVAYATGSEDWRYLGTSKLFEPRGDLRLAVDVRREKHNRELALYRARTWPEWHSLYPATMGTAASNYFINRRLFMNYEPFVDSAVIRWSAHAPRDWKLNRRVFHRAVKPLLSKVKFMRHAKGTFPFLGWQVNGPLSWFLQQLERVKRKYRAVFNIAKRNEGPWPVWKEVVSQKTFHRLASFGEGPEKEKVRALLGDEVFSLVCRSLEGQDPIQRLVGLQIRLWAGMITSRRGDFSG